MPTGVITFGPLANGQHKLALIKNWGWRGRSPIPESLGDVLPNKNKGLVANSYQFATEWGLKRWRALSQRGWENERKNMLWR